MNKLSRLLTILAMTAAIPMAAHAAGSAQAKEGAAAQQPAAGVMADGEVKKIDKDAGKMTIKHGPLVNLDMPPMTMVFRVKDAAMLDQVKSGDQIRFSVEKINGALTVTAIEASK